MGLDISAMSNIQKLDCQLDEDGEPITDREYIRLFVNTDFPGRNNDIETGLYSFDEYGHFFSRGYSGYGHWRNQLAELAGWPAIEYESWGVKQMSNAASAWAASEGPFWELINFSDCEGVIGANTCKKLLEDFNKYQPQADAHSDERFRQGYEQMRSAFEIGANNGAVKFH